MENINLIRKIAWDFYKTTRVEWDDLFQEAAIAYFEALKTYDPDRGKITTHAWYCITNHLKNYLKEQEEYKCRKFNGELTSIEEAIRSEHPAQIASDFWEGLTEDAKVIAEIVLDSAELFVVLPVEQAEERIKNIMHYNGSHKWPNIKIEKGIQELKKACL